jgi:hypothetical protein
MEKRGVVMQCGMKKIAVFSVLGVAAFGLCIANEKRRSAVIIQNEAIASKAQQELAELRALGFLDRDISVRSVSEQLHAAKAGIDLARCKWWMISIKTEENKSKIAKLKRLLSLNTKILKSYKQDLNDLRKFGFPENDPRVIFSRNRVAQTVVELAHLGREYKHAVNKKDYMTDTQIDLLRQMIALNQESVANYKAAIKEYLEQGLDPQDKRVQLVRSKMSAKLAENGLLERKLHR